MKILLVEDEALVAMALQRELKAKDITCLVAATAQSAIDLSKAEAPELVLMDIRLSGEMNGIAAARVINHDTGIPICFLSGYYNEDIPTDSLDFEPLGFLQKPVSANTIVELIRTVIPEPAAEER